MPPFFVHSRTNSGEVSQLHDKINELETQLETIKHTKYVSCHCLVSCEISLTSPPVPFLLLLLLLPPCCYRIRSFETKVSVHHHQKLALDSSNWKDFRFKGVIYVKNKLGADIESIEVIPDLIDFMVNGTEPFLKQAIFNVDLALAPKPGQDITIPKTVSFFYYLQHKSELRQASFPCDILELFLLNPKTPPPRYDYLFNIHLSYKSVNAELTDFVESLGKTPLTNGNNTFEMTDFCNGHEIKTKIQVTTNSEGLSFSSLSPLRSFLSFFSSCRDPYPNFEGVCDPVAGVHQQKPIPRGF